MDKEYIILTGKYKQLTEAERGQIEAYMPLNVLISEIVRRLNRSKSTIWNEIKRSKYKGKYSAKIAQDRALKRRSESHKCAKWRDVELLHFIEMRLKMRRSPEIISHKLLEEKRIKFSHTSIYTLIKKHNPELKKFLVYKGKRLTRCLMLR